VPQRIVHWQCQTAPTQHTHTEYKDPNVSYQSVDHPELLRHLDNVAAEQINTPLLEIVLLQPRSAPT
jgi:hypothetical protein